MTSPVSPASRLSTTKHRPAALDQRYIRNFVDELFSKTLHEKRLESLSNSVLGVLHAAVLAIHAIGAAYAAVAQRHAKHGIKQVDRWLSNPAFDVARLVPSWVEFVVGFEFAGRDSSSPETVSLPDCDAGATGDCEGCAAGAAGGAFGRALG